MKTRPAVCLQCSEPFESKWRSRRWTTLCSHKCSAAAAGDRVRGKPALRAPRRDLQMLCETCRKPFASVWRHERWARFCSKSCSTVRQMRVLGPGNKTHDESRPRSKEYLTWLSMRSRCNDPKCRSYKWYGARGIKVCDRWLNSYENFLADMGRKPPDKHSIDRINNYGDYEPGNCRWATNAEQARNKRPRGSCAA